MEDRSIRPAERADAAVVRDLVRSAYSKYVERIGKEPAPMLEDYDALIRAGEVWVWDEGGDVLGLLVMRPAEDHLYVGNVAVAPGHQGRGLGRQLVAFAEERATAWSRRRLPARVHAQAAELMGLATNQSLAPSLFTHLPRRLILRVEFLANGVLRGWLRKFRISLNWGIRRP
jgi:GNAT superfamily N-acetyltransferase